MAPFRALAQGRRLDPAPLMPERDDLVLQAAPVQHMLAQPVGHRIRFADARRKRLGEMSDHPHGSSPWAEGPRVQPIGLGQLPGGAGKLAHLRVDHRRGQPGLA